MPKAGSRPGSGMAGSERTGCWCTVENQFTTGLNTSSARLKYTPEMLNMMAKGRLHRPALRCRSNVRRVADAPRLRRHAPFISAACGGAQGHQTHAQAWGFLLDAADQLGGAQGGPGVPDAQQARVEAGIDLMRERQHAAGEANYQQEQQHCEAKVAMQPYPELASHGRVTSGARS